MMVTLGTDAHKKSHTIVAIDDVGAEIASVTVAATPEGHLRLVKWAARWEQRRWAIEDCRQLSRRLEADLLRIGDQVVRVPPKLMAGVRRSARTRGKSDPIDALAVARAALREPDLPVAQLDGPSREVRLLVDYRESLVKDRTAAQNRLRWRLHELEPGYDPPPRFTQPIQDPRPHRPAPWGSLLHGGCPGASGSHPDPGTHPRSEPAGTRHHPTGHPPGPLAVEDPRLRSVERRDSHHGGVSRKELVDVVEGLVSVE